MPRIVVTADLHYRPAERAAYAAFAQRVADLNPDCFVLAGDVGHPLRLFARGLQLFEALRCPRLLLAGNHDVYRGTAPAATGSDPAPGPPGVETHDSRALWETLLPAVAAAEDFIWLEGHAYRLGTTAICGTLGWYDYSARSPHLPIAPEEYVHLKKLVNHDADYIDWPWSDRAMSRYLARRLEVQLQALAADPTVRRIVVVTHVPIFAEALPPYPQSELYSLQRAYLGNFTLGEIVRRYAKVTHVVSGHLHRNGRYAVEGAGGPIDFRVVGSQGARPAVITLDLEE